MGEIYVDPRVAGKTVHRMEAPTLHDKFTGQKIKDLYYVDGNHGLYILSFEDTDNTLFINRAMENRDELKRATTKIVTRVESPDLIISDIQGIYLTPSKTYSDMVRIYEEKYALIKCKHTTYLIFSEGADYEEHQIKIFDVGKSFARGKMRKIKTGNLIFKGLSIDEKNQISGVKFETMGKTIVFETDTFSEMALSCEDLDYIPKSLFDNEGRYKLKFTEVEL